MTAVEPRPRGRRLPVVVSMIAVAALTVAAIGAGTYALWSSEDTFAGSLWRAGDLSMTTEDASWRQVTPGVTEPRSGDLAATPEDFFTMPGDVIEITQSLDTYLRGENLTAALSVEFASPGAVRAQEEAGDISVTMRVEDADGNTVATGSADGVPLAVPGLVGSSQGESDQWSVIVTVEVRGEYTWTGGDVRSATGIWAAGDLIVRLDQARGSVVRA
ncbi:SipW-dependent-type signal peptide-containing protein [Microbacterium sp. WCS2018Hpa-9]|uniref:SipW-dependent-type signal peptide-containing protein n=1 Tax=Microbacterium sp. WCS2018Hpa-9 TaxID=3073635 RepID=UPI00288C40F9|nr:SipW-dependent-type signal peptide-containing protein [Microbacterium sp. WCS2018Hpa-9]